MTSTCQTSPGTTNFRTTNANGQPFIEVLNDHFLTQANHFPTRGKNIPHLVITSVPEHITITDVESPENAVLFTDHCLEFRTKSHRYTYDYGKGDFDGLRSALSAKNLRLNLDHANINDDWQSRKDTFLDTVSKHIPRKKIKGRNPLPRINGTILNLIKKKNTVRRKMKLSPSSHLAQTFKKLNY